MGTISAVDWSRDGSLVAVAGSIGIHLYDARTFKIVRIIPTERPVGEMAFSRDGRRLMSLEWWIKGLHIWDTTDGELLQSFDIWTGPWNCAALSPDGQTVALADDQHDGEEIQLWDVTSGQLQTTLSGHRKGVRAMAFSPGGHLLASAGKYDNSVRLWDVDRKKLLWTLPHQRWVPALAFTPDGNKLATGEGDMRDDTGYVLRLWDPNTGMLIRTLVPNTVGIDSLHFSPDGWMLAGLGSDNTVRLWDATTGTLLRSRLGQAFVVGFSPDGKRLLSGDNDNTLQLWDTRTGQLLNVRPTDYGREVYHVTFSPNGQFLASLGADGYIWLRSTQTGQVLRKIKAHDSNMVFAPNSHILVSWSDVDWKDTVVHFWDTGTGKMVRKLDFPGIIGVNLTFSPDGKRLALAAWSNTVQLRDSSSGTILRVFTATVSDMTSVAFSPDGRLLAASSWEPYEQKTEDSVWLWDIASGQLVRGFGAEGGYPATLDLAFSPDGRLLATASRDQKVQLWDPSMGKLLYTLEGGGYTVKFSPDGSLLASGDLFYDGINAQLWDPRTGKLLQILKGHTLGPVDIAFSPDGRVLATGARDGTIRLWGVPAP